MNRTLGLLLFASATSLAAQPPAMVVEKLRLPAQDVRPLLLFTDSADRNEGAGEARWVASSGTRLTARDRCPWGEKSGAFGPEDGAASGAAIASSIESPLLTGETGALVFCVRLPEVTGNPAMIISRGAWGDHSAFDLRADKTQSLVLYTRGETSKPEALRLGSYVVGEWMFVGLSWKKKGGEFQLDVLLGELSGQKGKKFTSYKVPQIGEPGAPVLLAGRTNRDLSPALLTGGVFCTLAIYQDYLPEEVLESLFTEIASTVTP